jgi:hypothetical protein
MAVKKDKALLTGTSNNKVQKSRRMANARAREVVKNQTWALKTLNKSESKDKRQYGIEIMGDVPWGTHFCQFYETSGDLIEILAPYFRQGLRRMSFACG